MTIAWLFGIKFCESHEGSAERDIKAYMHHRGLVKMEDAVKHPALSAVFAALSDKFPVKRTNGEIQDGWSLDYGLNVNPTFVKRTNNLWTVPARYGDDLFKNVPIEGFPEVISALEEGIYLKFALEQEQVPLGVYTDEPVVQLCEFEGQLVRVCLPP